MQQSWLNLRVLSRRAEAEDIVGLVLARPDGGELPPFTAGAHIDVEAGPDLVRQYSLCNNPRERDRYEIAVLRDPGSRGGSVAIHERFREGDAIRVGQPRNHFELQTVKRDIMLIAGGIGVTPLLCMAEQLSALEAPFSMHYCTRTLTRTAFRERIVRAPFSNRIFFHFDDGPDTQRFDPKALFAGVTPGTEAYVCGPSAFIDWVYAAATEAGFPGENIYREYFAANAAGSISGDPAFQLRIASTGEMIDVAAGESAAKALARHGIELPISCEQGVCGTCITRVLEGEPDHRDMLMIDGNHEFTPCCSRALSPVLVLDL
jgi:vanillate O-demethylase ferredoxin subunit